MAQSKSTEGLAARDGDIDARAIGRALRGRKWWIIAPTLATAVLAGVGVNLLTPKFKSEARILYEGKENIFLRPEAEKTNIDRSSADQEAMASQVQLVLSRELALQAINQLKLNERPEFDPVLSGLSPLKHALVLTGISRDPFRMTPEERVLESYYERLSAFPVEKSRVITLEFQSSDPELATSAANAIAEGYLALQRSSKQDQSRAASQWLAGEIETLRRKVADAEDRAGEFRSHNNLFVGTNNTTLSNQQLGEFSSQLAAARTHKADAETRARLIRDMLRRGEQIEAADIVNSELIRRLSEQRVALRAQLAEQSSTLLDAHPRIKELKAQLADLDQHIRSEAEKLVRSLENDARIAGAQVDALNANLDTLKRQAASTNEDDVKLRALEREARAQRELLESYLAKFREASARESIGSAPADARIISRAIVSNTPFFPKKLPIVLVATLATLVLTSGFVISGELLRATVPDQQAAPALVPGDAGIQIDAAAYREVVPGGVVPAGVVPGRPIGVIDELARSLRAEGERQRIAVFGATRDAGAPLAAITLARALAADAHVVLVKIAADAPDLAAIPHDPNAPGISDVIRGSASFGEIIMRDKLSRVQLVVPGRAALSSAAILASPQFAMMVDALAHAYDDVVIDAGVVPETGLDHAAKLAACGVLVASELEHAATTAAQERLAAAGYRDVAVLVAASSSSARQPQAA